MDDDYRPRSPDLTAAPFESYDEPVHPQHQQYRGSISHVSPYTPITPVGAPADNYFARQQNISQPAWHQPQYGAFQPQSPQQFHQSPVHQLPQNPSFMQRNLAIKPDVKSEPMDDDYEPTRRGRGRGPGTKKAKDELHEEEMMPESNFHGPEIRTKFPVARIKRIMQADEDVGKVAQVTPIVVSRALELFMTALITKSAEEARTRGSKRVLPAHLKQAVKANEQFDFLSDIVEKVPDAPPPSQRKGPGGDGDSEDEGRKKRPGRRKKSDMAE